VIRLFFSEASVTFDEFRFDNFDILGLSLIIPSLRSDDEMFAVSRANGCTIRLKTSAVTSRTGGLRDFDQ